jgi:alkylhydroperoxidase/carboxymuconolactone decarboxylase family protein YurZ
MNEDRTAFLRLRDEAAARPTLDVVMRRPGIDERTRALLALSMVAARCEDDAVPAQVRRCVAQGLGRSEVGEALLQVYCYAGVYAGLSSFTAARTTFDAMEREGALPAELAAVRNPPAPSTTIDERAADGARMRRTLFGDDNVDRNEREADDFMNLFWRTTHEFCFGNIWSRPLFDRTLRSQLCLAIASAAGQAGAIDRHVRSALRGGVARERIGEIFILAGALAGEAFSRAAFEKARQVLDELDG